MVRAITPMESGYWWVSRASKAVKLHNPAVKRMKKGSSFFGYTDTSWNTGNNSRSAHSVFLENILETAYVLYFIKTKYQCNWDRDRRDGPSLKGMAAGGRFLPKCSAEDSELRPLSSNVSDGRKHN